MEKFKVNSNNSYKIGLDEIEGLESLMSEALVPITEYLEPKIYWENEIIFRKSEYKSRDGFISNSDNCGGLVLTKIIPKCEEYEFDFLEFGECDECADEPCGGDYCVNNDDGFLDAKLHIWFKFEGLNDDGTANFWLYCGGGNSDAPYFRTKYESDIFEYGFSAKSIPEFRKKSKTAVKNLIKILSGSK